METKPLPEMSFPTDDVDAKRHVASGTSFAFTLAAFVVGLLYLVITVGTFGVALIPLLFSPIIAYFANKKAMAIIHGSGICINENQMPQIHDCVVQFCDRLGLQKIPEVYLVEDSVLNAAAVKFGKRDVILLTDDMIHGCLINETKNTLGFVLGHELAHISLGHLGTFRTMLKQAFKKLSRLDEFSADAVAMALVGDKKAAIMGLMILTAGSHIVPYVNAQQLVKQSQEVEQNKYSKKAERALTHPLMLRRIYQLAKSE